MITELTTKEVYVLELESGARYSGSDFKSAFKNLAKDSLAIEVLYKDKRKYPIKLFRQFEVDLSPLKLIKDITQTTKEALQRFRDGSSQNDFSLFETLRAERYFGIEKTALMLLASGKNVMDMAEEKCPAILKAMEEEYNKSLKVTFKVK